MSCWDFTVPGFKWIYNSIISLCLFRVLNLFSLFYSAVTRKISAALGTALITRLHSEDRVVPIVVGLCLSVQPVSMTAFCGSGCRWQRHPHEQALHMWSTYTILANIRGFCMTHCFISNWAVTLYSVHNESVCRKPFIGRNKSVYSAVYMLLW